MAEITRVGPNAAEPVILMNSKDKPCACCGKTSAEQGISFNADGFWLCVKCLRLGFEILVEMIKARDVKRYEQSAADEVGSVAPNEVDKT